MPEDREWLTAHLVEQAALVLRLSGAAESNPPGARLRFGVRDEVFKLRENNRHVGGAARLFEQLQVEQ